MYQKRKELFTELNYKAHLGGHIGGTRGENICGRGRRDKNSFKY
jgi:hypothetical protein